MFDSVEKVTKTKRNNKSFDSSEKMRSSKASLRPYALGQPLKRVNSRARSAAVLSPGQNTMREEVAAFKKRFKSHSYSAIRERVKLKVRVRKMRVLDPYIL